MVLFLCRWAKFFYFIFIYIGCLGEFWWLRYLSLHSYFRCMKETKFNEQNAKNMWFIWQDIITIYIPFLRCFVIGNFFIISIKLEWIVWVHQTKLFNWNELKRSSTEHWERMGGKQNNVSRQNWDQASWINGYSNQAFEWVLFGDPTAFFKSNQFKEQ